MAMYAAAQFHAVSEFDHSYLVSVLFAEQGHGAHSLCFLHSSVKFLLKGIILADEGVHHILHLAELFG